VGVVGGGRGESAAWRESESENAWLDEPVRIGWRTGMKAREGAFRPCVGVC
jgi:hypothetical protein